MTSKNIDIQKRASDDAKKIASVFSKIGIKVGSTVPTSKYFSAIPPKKQQS